MQFIRAAAGRTDKSFKSKFFPDLVSANERKTNESADILRFTAILSLNLAFVDFAVFGIHNMTTGPLIPVLL